MALSEKLYELRKKDGLSQEQLAERLGVSRQAVSKWESGKAVPESDTLISISEYFDVSLDYLMKEDDSAVSEPVIGAENVQPTNNTGREKRILDKQGTYHTGNTHQQVDHPRTRTPIVLRLDHDRMPETYRQKGRNGNDDTSKIHNYLA